MAEPARTRVALITTSFPLETGSMSGVFVHRLAERLAEVAEVQVVVPAGAGRPSPRPAAYRLHAVRYAPSRWRVLAHRPGGLPAVLARPSPALLLLPALVAGLFAAALVAGRRADVLHGQWAIGGVLAGAAGRLLGKAVVTTLRGSDVARAERSRLDRRLLALCLRLSDAVVAVSPALAERARALEPVRAEAIEVIPNGIDDAFFAVPPAVGQPGRLRLLGVGNLIGHKDVDTVVRAVAALPPAVELTWLGDGPLRAALSSLAADLGAGDRVRFVGAVPPAAVPRALEEHDVFVFSSRGEGRPNALLEALAAGRPAVAPAVPGVVDLATPERGVLAYPAGDPAALRLCLSRLAGDDELRGRLAAAARSTAPTLVGTWQEAAARYDRLYRRLLADRRGTEAVIPPLARTDQHEAKPRFAFGRNWRSFLRTLDDDRVARAEASLVDMLGVADLAGASFLDIGSGSGLFSLAARRLGAEVFSFDFDADSVACTRTLRERYFPDDAGWRVERGSVLDGDWLARLGTFDVVYSWGVLHHTGDMWRALDAAAERVAPGGKLFIALYNDQGLVSRLWRAVKRLYVSGPPGRAVVLAAFVPAFVLFGLAQDLRRRRDPRRRYRDYRRERGMSVLHDWIDWLGGYPFEVTGPGPVIARLAERGLTLRRFERARGLGNNQFVFERASG